MFEDELWRASTKAGTEAYINGQYRQARARYRAAIRDAKERKDAIQVAICLHNLSLIYKDQKRTRKAFKLMKKALDFLEEGGKLETRLASQILDKLADLTVSKERRRAIISQDRRRAIAFLERAHEIDCLVAGPYQSQIAKRLLRLAQLHYEQDDYDMACRLYKEACDTTIIRHDRQTLLRSRSRRRMQERLGSKPVQMVLVQELDFTPPATVETTANAACSAIPDPNDGTSHSLV